MPWWNKLFSWYIFSSFIFSNFLKATNKCFFPIYRKSPSPEILIATFVRTIFRLEPCLRFESRRKRFCEKSSARLQSPKTNFCKITFVAWFQLVLGFFNWIETAKANTESQLCHNGKKPKTQSVSWIMDKGTPHSKPDPLKI